MPQARKDAMTWFAGGYYHLFNRGARRITIFREEKNYLFVLLSIKKYLEEFDLSMIPYCLMPNHYHFLVRQNGDVKAGLLPQRVFNSYTKAYNKIYDHCGTLFERRYQAIHIDNDSYSRHLCRYIHANPVKDGMAIAPEYWSFSNYQEWIGKRKGTLVDHDFIREYFATADCYKRFVVEWLTNKGQMPKELANYLSTFESRK